VELREFMSIRRAYNLVRQSVEPSRRLTFEGFSILCHLEVAETPVKTSDIADYQGALRPTMTHRTNHLAELGFIERGEGLTDRRNIVCSISAAGSEYVHDLAARTCACIASGQSLARTNPDRIIKYADAIGSLYCTAGDLVLLGLLSSKDQTSTVTGLVDRLGLLQPTVSMSVSALAKDGLVMREKSNPYSARSLCVHLTDEGYEHASAIADKISQLVVHRRSRHPKAEAAE
jgi:DNA-binding MarR family transcriptional regulator